MQEPEFIGGDVDLRINIYRSYVDTPNGENDAKSSLNDAKNEENDAKNGENDAKNGENDAKNGLNDAKKQKELRQEERLLHVIKENPCETQAYYADQLGLWNIEKSSLGNYKIRTTLTANLIPVRVLQQSPKVNGFRNPPRSGINKIG